MITGLTTATFENLQLNAGVFLKNFDFSSAKNAADLKTLLTAAIKNPAICLGATRGGGTFKATPTTREIDADGKRNSFVGSTHIDEWDIHLTTTLLEYTADNLKLSLGAAKSTTTCGITKISLKPDFEDDDYIDTICWVGDTNKGFTLIEIDNALSVGGMNLTFTDKNEGTIPLDLTAHMATMDESDEMPAHIYLIEGTAVA